MPERPAARAARLDGVRIAVVVSQLGLGGAERQTALLLERLAERPWRPVLVGCLSENTAPYGDRIEAFGYPLRVLPRRGSFDLLRLLRLRRLLRRERIDLVHAVHLLASGYAFLATAGRGPALLPSARGTVVWPALPKRIVYRAMFRRCYRTLVNSHAGAGFLVERYGAPPERLAVVPNGIDVAAVARAAERGPERRRELGIGPDELVLLFVGKDAPVKNVPRFLELLRRLEGRGVPFRALLAGIGLTPERLRELAPDLPPTRVAALGPRPDVPELMGAADVLLLTSDSEGCPNVVLESLAAGTPVVAAAVGDVPRIVDDGTTGFVVPPGAIDAYAAAIERILAAREAFRERIRERRDALEKRYGLDAMVEATVACWADVAARARRVRRPG